MFNKCLMMSSGSMRLARLTLAQFGQLRYKAFSTSSKLHVKKTQDIVDLLAIDNKNETGFKTTIY